jgi:hypothetical protein
MNMDDKCKKCKYYNEDEGVCDAFVCDGLDCTHLPCEEQNVDYIPKDGE